MIRLSDLFQPPYRLQTILLLILSALTITSVALNGWLSYTRINQEAVTGARQQAEAIVNLVAKARYSRNAFSNQQEVMTLADHLTRVVELPGVIAVSILDSNGLVLTSVQSKQFPEDMAPIGSGLPDPEQLLQVQEGKIGLSGLEIWRPIEADAADNFLGWVRVDYSIEMGSDSLRRLLQQSLTSLLMTLLLILVALPLLLNRILRPLRVLSRMASGFSSKIGSQLSIKTMVKEVQSLVQVLNQSSREVADQFAYTHIVIKSAAVPMISLDADGKMIAVNPATTSFFGLEESELRGRPIEICIPGLDGTVLREFFGNSDANENARIIRYEFFGKRLDGTPFPIVLAIGHAPKGGELRYICIVRDVTDERAALETSELYERALASSHNGVFITNAALDSQPIVFVNEAFQHITGMKAHEILGRSLDLLRQVPGDELGIVELKNAINEQRSTSVTLRHELINGRHITAEVSLSPVRSSDGRLTHFVGIVSDVTARIQAEEAIAEHSAQLDSIFSLSPDGFVLFDAENHLTFVNPAFERMTGQTWKSSGGAMTRQVFENTLAGLCHPEHPFPPMQLADAQEAPWQARLILARPQHRVVLAQARHMSGRQETVFYFRDVTHEDEVDRMKSEFLASAAHELRTPMVSIFGFTELLLKREFSSERRSDMLKTIHRQSGLLVKMINELLDLARIESRRGLDMNIGEHPLLELVKQSVHGLMRPDDERQVLIDAIPDVLVLIDPEKMQLALNNLLSNAFKYSPQGGDVVLSGQLLKSQGHDYAVLEVRDHGLGMTAEQLQRAFERFYRADTTGNIPGTGLGLSLVKEIAELHGGRVELESTYGSGTRARIWIPRPETLQKANTQSSSRSIAAQAGS